MTQLLTLGLDGAGWHKLDRMVRDGDLPNLERMVEAGARGTLESVHPPVTCPAWRCSTSGKNPGKLGVFWWLDLDRGTGELSTPDATSFDTADVWDYLSAASHRVAVLNVPMTYPPPAVDGLAVAGFGAPFEFDVDGSLTHPPEEEARLREEYGWAVGVDDVTAPGGAEAAYDCIRSRFELLLDVLADGSYDYVHLTVFYINVLQHKFGDGPETARGWRLIDDYLGKLPEDLTTLVYSDHGHAHIDRTFVVNKYLADRGYLTFADSPGGGLTGGLYSALERAGISPRRAFHAGKRVLPDRLLERVVEAGYPVPTADLAGRVDWERTDALALSQGPLYLNRDRLDDPETFRAELRAELASLTVDGETPLAEVHPAEAVYEGPHVPEGPDLLLLAADGWELYGGLTPSTVERRVTSWTSGNHPDGVVLLQGPDIERGGLPDHSLVDIAPTVLRYLDCPVPNDVDGQAIESGFAGGLPEPGQQEPLGPGASRPAGGAEASDGEALEQRLTDLGYLE